MQMPIAAASITATALAAFAAIPLSMFISWEGEGAALALGVALAALAIAGPLFGGVAAWKMRRWSPLALGSSLGLTSILAMALIVRLSY